MSLNERPSVDVNQQLQDYMVQLQSDVGSFGKTLHQVISDYLALKSKNPDLAQSVDALSIPQAEQTTFEHFEQNRKLMCKLQSLSEQAAQGLPSLADHPWKGFAHHEHQNENSEAFIRMMRFVGIQLSKFWVEVQSFPIFLNGLPQLSLQEVETIFHWLQNCPSWKDNVQQAKLIPALIQPESRKSVFDFARDVKSARVLQEKISDQISSEFLNPQLLHSGAQSLARGVGYVRQYHLGTENRAQLIEKINFLKTRVEHVKNLRDVLDRLAREEGMPLATRPSEVRMVLQGVNCIRNLPQTLIPWRNPRILASHQRVRLQVWKDRAKPLLEARKRLEATFQMERVQDSEKLRGISYRLTSAGFFRVFSSSYKNAVQAYRDLLLPELAQQKKRGESRLQMSERLLDWANYLEQGATFENQPDLKTVFGSLARGFDTDFTSAMAVNSWSQATQEQLKPELSEFAQKLTDWIFTCPEKSIQQILASVTPLEADLKRSLDSDSAFLQDRDLASIQTQDELELADYTELLNLMMRVSYREDGLLLGLESCQVMLEELAFLVKRMEDQPDLKAVFRSSYRGSETDLNLIDQALNYIQSIENAAIPEGLKDSFLSAQGPQRIADSKGLVNGALNSLAAVRDHLDRLNTATQGQIQEWVEGPLPQLMNRIQSALKQPALLSGWVEYLKCQYDAKLNGLEPVLEFLEKSPLGTSFELTYELAFYASLLKKFIGNSGNATAVLDLRTFH